MLCRCAGPQQQDPCGSLAGDSPMGASPGGSVISAGFWTGHFDSEADRLLDASPEAQPVSEPGVADTASSPSRSSKRKKLLPQHTSAAFEACPALLVRLLPSTHEVRRGLRTGP